MGYYVRTLPTTSQLQAWRIEADEAVNLGIPNAELVGGAYFKASPGETIWENIRKNTPWFEPDGQSPFHETRLRPGEYYPRMARPILDPRESPGSNPGTALDGDFVAIARSQLTVLTRQLDRICQTVHPTPQTFETFGHDIRNLLILSCTEVEAHWRGVLKANGVQKKRFTTVDFVRLLPTMKLDEYAVSFPSYPWLQAVQPYKGWGSSGNPTQDIKWYDSYNAVKHDREAEFEKATLRHAFEAISACVIMMVAQFGPLEGAYSSAEPLSYFRVSALPIWSPPDVYMPPFEGSWTPVKFPF